MVNLLRNPVFTRMVTILNYVFTSVFIDENCITIMSLVRRIDDILDGILITKSDVLRTMESIKITNLLGQTKFFL